VALTGVEQALLAVVRRGCLQEISTRKVDGLVNVVGLAGILKSHNSRLCAAFVEMSSGTEVAGLTPNTATGGWTRRRGARDGWQNIAKVGVPAIGVRTSGERMCGVCALGRPRPEPRRCFSTEPLTN
jgi:hypothetical protein